MQHQISKQVARFRERLPLADRKAFDAFLRKEDLAGIPLEGRLSGYYLRKNGRFRVVFRVEGHVCYHVYAENVSLRSEVAVRLIEEKIAGIQ